MQLSDDNQYQYRKKVSQLREAVKDGLDELMEFRLLNEPYFLSANS